jgi:hypothetical protein
MPSRGFIAIGILSIFLLPDRSWAEGPPRTARNVIIVTLDGFRPQEFFTGAEPVDLKYPQALGLASSAANSRSSSPLDSQRCDDSAHRHF